LDAGADVLVLGCTHYPFLRTAIEARVPDHVRLIDTGPAVAKRTESFLTSSPDLSKEPAEIHIETTGSLEQLNLLLPKLLPEITASTSEAAF
ncbi:MAG: glutamate racemase, partial [Verrucomicrobiota bacterium]